MSKFASFGTDVDADVYVFTVSAVVLTDTITTSPYPALVPMMEPTQEGAVVVNPGDPNVML